MSDTRSKLLRLLIWTGTGLAGVVLLLSLVVYSNVDITGLSTFEFVKSSYITSDKLLLDRHGETIHELRVCLDGRRLEWTELKDISPAFIKAVIQVEDKRFYRHNGIDWYALGACTFRNIVSKKARGASTITMQTVSILDKRLKPKGLRRGLKQKWNQILAGLALEKIWSKNQIIEAYVNLISYRGELQGISAASRGLFGKDPSGLNQVESLILASLISSPNSSVDKTIRRASYFGNIMGHTGISDQIKYVARDSLALPYRLRQSVAIAPHVAHMLLKDGKNRVFCTLDGRLQRFAYELLKSHLAQLKEGNVSDGSILVADNKTGHILAYVGNSGSTSSAPQVDGIRAKRQAGSTLKPFLYGLAIENGILTTASVLEDMPLHIATPTGLYVPQNYDNTFRVSVSVRTALSSSINIPAVWTLLLVGLEPFIERLRDLGFNGLAEDAEHYGYSMALGSVDITLFELVNAYRTLANRGKCTRLTLSLDGKNTKPVKVFNGDAAFIISDILSDRQARSATFGLENPLSTRFWTAVKTGTSKDMRDNWCVGYSEKYVVGVWVGNFSGEPMRNVSGVSGAAPLWLEIMNYLHKDRSSTRPQQPPGVVCKRVTFGGGIEASREDCFINGTEPLKRVRLDSVVQGPHITYPADNTIIGVDNEIPDELQRVPFRFQSSAGRYEWVLNESRTGVFDPLYLWKPKRGSFKLSIVDNQNRVMDSVNFSVR